MKRTVHYPAALLLFCTAVCAQEGSTNSVSPAGLDAYMDSGMEVAGVRAPYYNEKGELQAQLYGGRARILEGGTADVTNIRIDVYENGVVTMAVFAPQCFTRVFEKDNARVLAVESEGDVLIDMEDMTICGHGFRFSSDGNRFEILSEAKVLVKESARNVEGLSL